jgi:2-dehydropantoate 2-reductase
VIAGGLLRSGCDLTIVTNNDEITNAIKNDGIRVSAPKDEWTVHAQAHTQLQDLQGTFDTVLLAMKATDVEQAVEDLRAYLSPSGYVVTLQNGIVEDRIGEMLGRERVIGALVGWGATMRKPGLYEMTSLGEVVIGESRLENWTAGLRHVQNDCNQPLKRQFPLLSLTTSMVFSGANLRLTAS